MNKIQPPVSPTAMAKKLGQVLAVKGIRSFLHVRVMKSTSQALCTVSPLPTLTLIYLILNLAIVYSYIKEPGNLHLEQEHL